MHKIQPEDCVRITFGLCQFRVTAFGSSGAPAILSQFMPIIFSKMKRIAMAYQDDILEFFKNPKEHCKDRCEPQ